jgi:hypothetical protein
MHQFGTHGIGKAADRRFGSAVGRLQGIDRQASAEPA